MEVPDELLKQVSIVVCTVDRREDLERCLESLRPFRGMVGEVIVVNNGPSLPAIEEIAGRHGARVTTELRRGVSRARNAGIRAARGNLVAFLDDDTQADKEWLPCLIAPLADSTVDGVLGAVRAENPADPVQQAFEQFVCAGVPDARTMLDAHAASDRFPLRLAMCGFTMNVVFRRQVFDRFGYFDERFGRGTRLGSGEDPDFFLKVLLHGGRILFEPQARVVHSWPTDRRALRRSLFQAGCGHTAILAKYFCEEPSLRGEIRRYIASRLRRRQTQKLLASPSAKLPRLPFLLGSLYGPLAFLLSPKPR